MKTHETLAKKFSKEALRERQKGVSLAIDKASGLQLAALRRRYWTLEKAIEVAK